MNPDIEAYFSRIGHHGARAPSLAALQDLVVRHCVAIPFENLDAIRGLDVRLDPAAIEDKLVADRRGGYCFEHNALFASVLRELGYQVATLEARVRWQVPPEAVTPRTHMVLCVDLEGSAWLVDVGFGGLTPTAPVRLGSPEPQPTPHETLRVMRLGDVHLLQAQVAGGWSDVYQFTLEACHRIDYEVANWYTSKHPDSRFTRNLIVSRALDDGRRLSLLNRELVDRGSDGVERRQLDTPEELLEVLADRFGLRFAPGTRFGSPGAPWPA